MARLGTTDLEQSPNRLLVEGRDDQCSILSLVARHGANWDARTPVGLPYVHDSGGCDPLLASISASAKTFHRLGIVIDADSSPLDKWTRVRDALSGAGIIAPTRPSDGGTIIQGVTADRRVGIWVMPDNRGEGKLEDFLAQLIPPNDRCWALTKEAVERARELGAQVAKRDEIQARIHTWLAWRREPGRSLGAAITSAYFDTDTSEARAFVDWFFRLFER